MLKYSIEKHGDGYALYFGRDSQHHGMRLCNLSDFDKNEKDTITLIESVLNDSLLTSNPIKNKTDEINNIINNEITWDFV